MGVGYIRQDTANDIADGKIASAAPLDAEFDGIVAAFASTTGHTHDGTTGEGGPIGLTGPAQDFVHGANAITPKTDDAYDLGSSSFEWRNLWVDGTANIDSMVSESVTITGGTINGTVIGGTTPAAITGTTITASSFVGTLTGSVVGNSNTATALQTTRLFSLTGDVTGSVNFNGTADAVISAVIPDGSIGAVKISDAGVTSAKIADSNVTTAKIANDAVTTVKIINSAVTTPKIADSAVTTVKIADGSIITAKLGDGNVTEPKLANSAVTTAKIADLSVTEPKLGAALVEKLLPSGAVAAFAQNTAPDGWLKANGQAVSRTTFAALFAAIGTTYGAGDGSTTFNVPDLRGEFVRGWDDGRGIDTGRVFGSLQTDAIRNIVATALFWTPNFALGAAPFSPTGAFTSVLSGATQDFTMAMSTDDRQATLLSFNASNVVPTASENRPRNVALLYCIKT